MTLAKDIVRSTIYRGKLIDAIAHLKVVSMRISSISTLNDLSSALNDAATAINLVSGKLDSETMKELMKTLVKEDARLDMKQDMLSDAMDIVGEGMSDETEENKLYQQILKEAGMTVEHEVNVF
jgi:charged multivesicular body protein 2B